MNIYTHIKSVMNNYKLFNDIEIKIKITPNVSNNPYEFYEIAEITIDDKKSNNLAFNERITKIRDSLNKSMQKDKFHKKVENILLIQRIFTTT
ncbi:hypothetical protein ACO2E3_06035 [Staphylococcus epidermidis]